MINWLLRRGSRPDPAELDRLRNEAVMIWLQRSGDDDRLNAFLARLKPHQRTEVEESARAIRAALVEFLASPFPGAQDAALVETAIHTHLSPRFPWMSEEAFEVLMEHIDWIDWGQP